MKEYVICGICGSKKRFISMKHLKSKGCLSAQGKRFFDFGIKSMLDYKKLFGEYACEEFRNNLSLGISKGLSTPEAKMNLKRARIRLWQNKDYRSHMCAERSSRFENLVYKQKNCYDTMLKKVNSAENYIRISALRSKNTKNQHKNEKYKKIMLETRIKQLEKGTFPNGKCAFGTMNKLEKRFFNLLNSDKLWYCSGTFYLKDCFSFMTPDFKVHGANKVVEVFGDYWHRHDDSIERVNRFKNLGYECLIVWGHEILENPLEVIEKVNNFISR